MDMRFTVIEDFKLGGYAIRDNGVEIGCHFNSIWDAIGFAWDQEIDWRREIGVNI